MPKAQHLILLDRTKGSPCFLRLCQLSLLLITEGSAGEAAEVLPRSRKRLCAGQVESWTELSGPRHRYD